MTIICFPLRLIFNFAQCFFFVQKNFHDDEGGGVRTIFTLLNGMSTEESKRELALDVRFRMVFQRPKMTSTSSCSNTSSMNASLPSTDSTAYSNTSSTNASLHSTDSPSRDWRTNRASWEVPVSYLEPDPNYVQINSLQPTLTAKRAMEARPWKRWWYDPHEACYTCEP